MLPKPIEKNGGPSASAASRPPVFRDGPQCSRERWVPSVEPIFGILAQFFGVFGSVFTILGVFLAFF